MTVTRPQTAELPARGSFSLQAAAEFGFGPNQGRPPAFDGVMRLAFALDGRGYAGAVLRQAEPDGPVALELELRDGGASDVALRQVARIVSLDHDGEAFAGVGARDPVIGELQRRHPGQRPVLFHSPYEAAAWAIISARRPAAQAARVRDAIAAEHGETFTLAGRELHAFPQPERLAAAAGGLPGLTPEKQERLRAVAEAALRGELDAPRLHELGPERAHEELQRLKGLGPFYAGLVVLRASGFADARLPTLEPRGGSHLARFYELGSDPDPARLDAIVEGWRPFRTWCLVLVRLAGDRAFGPHRGARAARSG
jgi:DNA-3-methyladenine glycosylase II